MYFIGIPLFALKAPDTTIPWYRSVERRGPRLRELAANPGFAGGEA